MAKPGIALTAGAHVLVADEAWVALATLHKKHPERQSFSAREILEQVKQERAFPELRPGVQVHIHQHNVANLEPNPARQRMFYKLEDDTFRLYRPGDYAHPSRLGKMAPKRVELPKKYHHLLDWYDREYCKQMGTSSAEHNDPILQMWGLGRELWADMDADEYVESLRAGWEEDDRTKS
jgi:hypothetical protein